MRHGTIDTEQRMVRRPPSTDLGSCRKRGGDGAVRRANVGVRDRRRCSPRGLPFESASVGRG